MNFKRIILTLITVLAITGISEAKKIKKISAADIVLFYAGGQSGSNITQDFVSDYVSYIDRDGNEHWLYDGYLLLQIWDKGENSSEVAFTPGMKDKNGNYMQAANQADWKKLIDYYFSDGACIDAIDKAVEEASARLGKPAEKRQIIISIPDPIPYKQPKSKLGGTTYWGLVDGKVTDFSKEEDRAAACKWFVDETIKAYKAKKYKNVELAGFYWLTEQSYGKCPLLPMVSEYVHSKGYPLTWIPYFEAAGYKEWKQKGFDMAWYQPNYFFRNVPESHLKVACDHALTNGLALEMEFDERAMAARGDKSLAHKLRSYMKAFKEYGPWEKCQLAYYQGSRAVSSLKNSSDPKDVELYQDLCDFIAKRPYRQNSKK